MEEYEYINTELGLATQGNFIYNKNSKFPTSTKLEEEEEEEEEEERPRKKLRLSKDQYACLEDIYRATTFSHQTKINQMKMECDYLKEVCDSLSNENQRLQRQLFELRRWVKPEPTPQAN
ncbi:uncharacterized protein A4U43_C05F19550 [Asparagus officinalis]|uniref:Leucine zipper homeobox-associated domain-containing protein n=2 Tax=Asparagus officinalis TaxID=4686 RepID=A0A5P1EWQ4_ASPOF|nr:uncharacterized protein A4U43_C05F19550 [Asparagus officinalis]